MPQNALQAAAVAAVAADAGGGMSVTEAEWLKCDTPRAVLGFLLRAWYPGLCGLGPDDPMWEYLLNSESGVMLTAAQVRKLRLWAAACFRDSWGHYAQRYGEEVPEYWLHAAVAAEQRADGVIGRDQRDAVRRRIERQVPSHNPLEGRYDLSAKLLGDLDPLLTALSGRAGTWANATEELAGRQARLAREVFGPPVLTSGDLGGVNPVSWGEAVTVPAGHPFLAPLVRRLVVAIRQDGSWEDLPVLADALEEAGFPALQECPHCDGWGGSDPVALNTWSCRACLGTGKVPHRLLDHLRTVPSDRHSERCGTAYRGCAPECPQDRWERCGPHVRGCWAFDAVTAAADLSERGGRDDRARVA